MEKVNVVLLWSNLRLLLMSVRTQTLRGKSYGSKLFHPFVSQLTRVLSLEHRQTPLVQTSAVKTNATRQIA